MDPNDFIFSDDVAESLGFRMDQTENEPLPANDGECGGGSGKAGLASIGGIALGIVSVLSQLSIKDSL